MKLKSAVEAWNKLKVDMLAVSVIDKTIAKGSLADSVDQALGGILGRILKSEEFKAKAGTARLIPTLGKLPAENVLLVSLGDKKSFSLESIRKGGAAIVSQAKAIGAASVAAQVFTAPEGVPCPIDDRVQAMAQGMILAGYSFDLYKSDKKAPSLKTISLFEEKAANRGSAGAIEKALKIAQVLSEATMKARTLVNTPPRDMTPRALAQVARKLEGVQVRVLQRREIEALKMNSFLSVSNGSAEPPVFIEMIYRPKKKAKKILAVVGKGVTFDSGGLSLKPPKSMETMKMDMAGAAAAISFMQVVGALKPAVEVRAYVAATENMPDGGSTRPGDIVTAMNGKTIEILNTDAEGRLTLADALHYAITRKEKPDYVVNMATLTGACVVALGERCTAAMGTDQGLVDKLKKAGEKTGEMIWQLPLIEEYLEDLKSTSADIQNSGGRYAGTITAGLFLKEFVGDAKWVHLDIAGSAWTEKALPYNPKGATGVMVRTLWELIQDL